MKNTADFINETFLLFEECKMLIINNKSDEKHRFGELEKAREFLADKFNRLQTENNRLKVELKNLTDELKTLKDKMIKFSENFEK